MSNEKHQKCDFEGLMNCFGCVFLVVIMVLLIGAFTGGGPNCYKTPMGYLVCSA